MTNWDKCVNELTNIGVGTFDVPDNFVKWLKDNISNKHKRNKNLAGHIKNEHGYQKWPDELEQFLIKPIIAFVSFNFLLEASSFTIWPTLLST